MMAPLKATPAKKQQQQSISSFFTPKTTNVSNLATKKQEKLPTTGSASEEEVDSTNLYDAGSSDDEVVDRSSRSPKRPLAEDPDAVNNGYDRATKRLKGDGSSSLPMHGRQPQATGVIVDGTNKGKTSIIPHRTEHFLYKNGGQKFAALESLPKEVTDNELVQSQKEILHQKFVKKLGHPDSIAQIKRKNWQISEETEKLDEPDAEGEEAEDETLPPTKGKKKGAKTGKLTPMELQMLEIKRKHMDAILIIEVGYKFKFFGEDARIAAKELGIVCIPGKFRFDEHPSEAHLDRFASASIPVHRLPVHAKRLVVAGHKVGVVRQIETAALKKAGDNRNTPFIRKLTNLYTKGTYIDDIDGLDQPTEGLSGGAPASGHLLCITETKSKGWGTDEKVDVGILAVQPATGDVILDSFEDGFMRSEIETRLLHISPCEFLIVGDLTKATEKLIQHLSGSSTNVFGDKIRVERIEKPKAMAAQSYSHVAQFYAGKMKAHGNTDTERASNLLDKILVLPELVTICLSAMITHMTEYGLEHVFDLTKYFQSFSARSHMLLNGNTLSSLELYHNQTDHTEKGSLFWTLDRTQTKFGQRLLRKWVGRPLVDKHKLEERVAAVEELKEGNQSATVDRLKSLLLKIKSDLERSLIRIYYGKCTRPELLTVLQTMQRIANEFAFVKSPADVSFKSDLINGAVAALPVIGDKVVAFLDKINLQAARSDDKYAFFRENEESDDISNHKLGIASVEQDLEAHRPAAAEKIRKKNVVYVTVAGIEYLIEVSNSDLKHVPASWSKISGTKKVSRFHTPEVVRMIRERDQHKESLAAACDTAFSNLLTEIASHYQSFRDCVSSLATLDCLLSLATIASQPGYVKPTYSATPEITISEGRHPMVEQLLPSGYIPNDTTLSSDGTRALLITGPNMGGKSSYVRQVALICIMAQIGSYVPAASARLGILDAVFTRMGAFDNMLAGESTFMVELSETSDIMKQATPRSLVILDELGRGTSTHDGVAIAHAVLNHVVRDLQCLCLFITHYQTLTSLASSLTKSQTLISPSSSSSPTPSFDATTLHNHDKPSFQPPLKNVHMAFTSSRTKGTNDPIGSLGEEEITFLFQIAPGTAHRSYGLNVARLAGLPRAILDDAAIKSKEMEDLVRGRKVGGLIRGLRGMLGVGGGGNGDGGETDERSSKGRLQRLISSIEEL